LGKQSDAKKPGERNLVTDGTFTRQFRVDMETFRLSPVFKALVKGLANDPDIDEAFLKRLAEEVRRDLDLK
jgi:hypothetical protein